MQCSKSKYDEIMYEQIFICIWHKYICHQICMSLHVHINAISHMPVDMYSNELHQHSCTDYTQAFSLEVFELVFTTGPNFVSCCFCWESPWLCSLQQKAEARIKNTSAPCVCCWFDKSSTPVEGEDTKVVATARGHLSGFAQRNLKHLNLFDHNLILEEARIYPMLAWYLSSDKLFLTHSPPWEDWMVESLQDCISF